MAAAVRQAGLVTQAGVAGWAPKMSNSGKPGFECHPRLPHLNAEKTRMPGMKPGMTGGEFRA